MRVKSRKQARAARTLREMNQRHEVTCRRWLRQEIAARKCRYRGYIVLALAAASGQNIHCWPERPAPIGRGRWMFRASGLNSHNIEEWRGVRHWRRAKKLAARIATRPVTWSSAEVMERSARVLPWRWA